MIFDSDKNGYDPVDEFMNCNNASRLLQDTLTINGCKPRKGKNLVSYYFFF